MKNLKYYILAGTAAFSLTSCNDFLTTSPKDAMTPDMTWKTQDDVSKFLTGCYDGFVSSYEVTYWDATSDFAYGNFPWEGFRNIGNGTFTASDPGYSMYDFTIIRRCNTLLENAEKASFSSDAAKKDLLAQCRFIRAYRYFILTECYGDVPIIDNFQTAQEAQVPRKAQAEVHKYIMDELNAIIPDLNAAPSQRGRVAKGAACALKMRLALYDGDFKTAKDAAQAIIDLGQYSLDTDYSNLFKVEGQTSPEIILAAQGLTNTYSLDMSYYFPNSVGGWSSVVPTQQCVDNYEMANGKAIDEAGSGYDPVHPFHGRDPRFAMSVIYPGCDWNGKVFNSLDKEIEGKKNPDYSTNADNATKTCYNWRKYADGLGQYAGGYTNANIAAIIFRYAEVLLTWAECENELNGPSDEVYNKIDQVRARVGMPKVDRTKYSTKETLRELIHRERGSEFAGEGIRRYDILRWKTTDGKMLAEKVLNVKLNRITGTLINSATKSDADPTMRATVDPTKTDFIEDRGFKDFNKLFPIPQDNIDKNPKLKQNPGYGAK